MLKRFHTIDGETLMNQPLRPVQFVVEGLLSNGLHLRQQETPSSTVPALAELAGGGGMRSNIHRLD